MSGTAGSSIPTLPPKSCSPAGFEKAPPDEIIPKQYLDHDAASYFGSVFVDGQSVGVAMSRIDDNRVFIFERPEPEYFSELEQYLFSMNVMLKDSLSVWKIASDLLLPYLETMDDERLEQYAAMMRHNYYALLRIASNNNYLCDIIREEGFLLVTECDIVAMCSEIMDSISTLVPDRGVKLRFEAPTDRFTISADCQKIEQLILNLLSNSLKYTPEGGKILLSLTPVGNKVILTVSDTGRGIPADKLRTVWNKCRWPREEETGVDRGIGTGLMIVQHIARLHGGSAVLESREGQGTKVTVILPVVQENELELSSSITNYRTRNMTHILTELSELLGYEYYFEEFMD